MITTQPYEKVLQRLLSLRQPIKAIHIDSPEPETSINTAIALQKQLEKSIRYTRKQIKLIGEDK